MSRAACMSRACVHESVTVGTSDVDEPGMMPAVYELERVLSVAASSTYTGTASVAKNAGVAIYDAVATINNPNATGTQIAGAIAKAAFKTTMAAIRTSPIVGLALGILDLTGATDALFKW